MSDNRTGSVLYQYIDTPEALAGLMTELRPLHTIALDTEADSFHHYRPKVCLIQLSFQDNTFIVDPLASIDIAGLLKELADKELIIHDAGYDLRLLNADFRFKPKNRIFDTKVAAALTGMEKVGLSDVLHHVTGAEVKKHNQRANWAKRPLPAHLLEYASEDTASLVQIKDHLSRQLERLGRTEWHIESCQAAVDAAYAPKEPTDPDNEWRVKGTGKLAFKEMAFLREIWYWREKIADKTNIAPFMICRNEEMIRLAGWAARRKKPIDDEIKLPIRVKSQDRNRLIKSLQKAQSLPSEKWPGPRKSDPSKRLPDSVRKVVNELKAECEKIAKKHDLALNLIASRSALTRIVLNDTTTAEAIRKKNILLNWQTALLLPAIEKVLR